jgi:hypothetical protein
LLYRLEALEKIKRKTWIGAWTWAVVNEEIVNEEK